MYKRQLLDVRGASNPQIKVSATNTGSNSAGLYIENQGQRNWQIWADRSSDQLRIGHASRTNTVVAITDQRVGIGSTLPLGKLHVRPADDCNFVVREESTSLVLSAETNNGRDNNRTMALEGGSFTFSISGNEKARIDSGGRVGIGTNQPQNYDNTAHQLVVGDNTGNRGITIATGTGGRGTLMFADGTSGVSAYEGFIQYDHFTNNLIFATAHSERARITSTGNLLCGATSATISTSYTLQVTGSRGAVFKSTGGGANPTQTLWNANSSGDSTLLEFRVNTTDTTVGTIVHDRSAGLVDYNTTSDYRAKTLNGRVENSGSIIDQLKVYNCLLYTSPSPRDG